MRSQNYGKLKLQNHSKITFLCTLLYILLLSVDNFSKADFTILSNTRLLLKKKEEDDLDLDRYYTVETLHVRTVYT